MKISSILLEKGFKIIWLNGSDKSHDRSNQDDFESTTVKVEYQKEGEIKQDYLRDFLEHECEDSLHEAIRTNVFIATRNFVQRVKAFRTEILMGKNNPDCITYWSDKMEFQGRGAGHIHGVAWCDLKKVSELIEKEEQPVHQFWVRSFLIPTLSNTCTPKAVSFKKSIF